MKDGACEIECSSANPSCCELRSYGIRVRARATEREKKRKGRDWRSERRGERRVTAGARVRRAIHGVNGGKRSFVRMANSYEPWGLRTTHSISKRHSKFEKIAQYPTLTKECTRTSACACRADVLLRFLIGLSSSSKPGCSHTSTWPFRPLFSPFDLPLVPLLLFIARPIRVLRTSDHTRNRCTTE